MSEEPEIDELLQKLVQSKQLQVKTENGKDKYSLTEKGIAETEEKIRKSEDTQLFLFTLFFKLEKTKNKDKHSILKEAVQFISKINPNFPEVLERACRDGRIQGLTLKE